MGGVVSFDLKAGIGSGHLIKYCDIVAEYKNIETDTTKSAVLLLPASQMFA